MYKVIDAAQDLSAHATEIAAAGVQAVVRYYNHRNVNLPTKRVTRSEALALDDAGLAIAVVFQQRGGAGGHIQDFSTSQGANDAERAMEIAADIGQPEGSAIYFAVDSDFVTQSDLRRIGDHFAAIKSALAGKYRMGVYGSGKVTRHILNQGSADLVWLAQATGWSGYQAMVNSQDWALLQKMPRVWPGNAFSYDGNIVSAAFPDFGQFEVNGSTHRVTVEAANSVAYAVDARNGLNLRRGPGTDYDIVETIPHGAIVHGLGLDGVWLRTDIRGDGVTDGYMHSGYLVPLAGALPPRYPAGATAYEIAKLELAENVSEFPGRRNNPRILLYHASTGHGDADAVPWCSSFVNYCVESSGLIGTDSKWAMSWHDQSWGYDTTDDPREGDVAVFKRRWTARDGTPKVGGHVGFLVNARDDTLTILGGNQSNSVSIANYPKSGSLGGQRYDLLSIRRAS